MKRSHTGLHLQFISFFKGVVKVQTMKSTNASYERKEGNQRWPKRMGCAYEYEPSTFLWMLTIFDVLSYWVFIMLLFCSWLCRCCQKEEFWGALSCSFSMLLLSYCSYHKYCYYGYYYYYFIGISCWQLKTHVVHYETFLCHKLYIYKIYKNILCMHIYTYLVYIYAMIVM